jgi:hypothetical protein
MHRGLFSCTRQLRIRKATNDITLRSRSMQSVDVQLARNRESHYRALLELVPQQHSAPSSCPVKKRNNCVRNATGESSSG